MTIPEREHTMTETNFEEALAKIGDSVRDLCAIVGIDTPENLVNIYIDPDGIAIEVTDKLGDVPVSRTVKLNGTITYRNETHSHEFEPFPIAGRTIQKCKFCTVLKFIDPDMEAAERAKAGLGDKTPADWVAKSIADAEAAGRPLDEGA